MTTYAYDGSFDGWCCVVFAAYAARETPAAIVAGTGEVGLFGQAQTVATDPDRAERVVQGIVRRGGLGLFETVYHAFQSDQAERERVLFRFARTLFADGPGPLDDWRNPDVRAVERMERLTRREVHRMHAFVRFEQATGAETPRYHARIEPEADVLPLIGEHFAARYPALDWTVEDVRRRRALVHASTLRTPSSAVTRMQIVPAEALQRTPEADRPEREVHVQKLWQTYFQAVTIPERKNPALHKRHLPRRYWRHLPEKRPDVPGRAA